MKNKPTFYIATGIIDICLAVLAIALMIFYTKQEMINALLFLFLFIFVLIFFYMGIPVCAAFLLVAGIGSLVCARQEDAAPIFSVLGLIGKIFSALAFFCLIFLSLGIIGVIVYASATVLYLASIVFEILSLIRIHRKRKENKIQPQDGAM